MKIRQVIIVAIILVAGVGLMKFLSSKKTEPEKSAPLAAERYVRVAEVSYSDAPGFVTASGRIQSAQSLILTAEIGGKLQEGDVPLKAAIEFSAGQTLYRISSSETRLALQAQKSDFIQLLATLLADIKIDFPESYPLWDKYFSNLDASRELPELPEIANRKEKTFLTSRKLYSLFYSIKSAEERLKRYAFVAPFDGSFAEVRAEAGSIVNPGAVIGRIIRTGSMEADITIAQEDIRWVKTGATVSLSSHNLQSQWKGRVARIGDYIDPTSQSIHIYISIDAAAGSRPFEGAFVEAEFTGEALKDVFEIPRKALLQGNKVFAVVNDSLQHLPVEIVKMNAETVLLRGPAAGTLVVVESLTNATEKMPVKVVREGE